MEIDRPKIKELAVSKIPIFASLNDQERADLTNRLMLRDHKKGTNIIISDQSGSEIMFVADGSVDIKRSSQDGKEVIISRLKIGDFFGEIALLTGSTRSADVIAVEDSMVLVLRASDFNYLLESNSNFTKALLVDLARRVATSSSRISDLALLDVYLRVFRALSSLSEKDKTTGRKVVKSRPTHKDLASMVGSSREMVTRALSRLEEDQAIQIEDEKVWILTEISV